MSELKSGDYVKLAGDGGFTDPQAPHWTISPGQVKQLPKKLTPRIADMISRRKLVAVDAPKPVDPKGK